MVGGIRCGWCVRMSNIVVDFCGDDDAHDWRTEHAPSVFHDFAFRGGVCWFSLFPYRTNAKPAHEDESEKSYTTNRFAQIHRYGIKKRFESHSNGWRNILSNAIPRDGYVIYVLLNPCFSFIDLHLFTLIWWEYQ